METSKPGWILLQNAYGLIIGYLIYYIIFRSAGVTAFGIFSFALSFGLVFSFVSDLGINTAHTRMIAAGRDRNEYNNALIFMKVVLTLTYIGVILASIFIWVAVLHKGFQTRYELLSILILIPYFFTLPYVQAVRSFFTGTLEAAKMAIPGMAESTTRLVAVVFFIRFNIFNISNLNEMALMIALAYSLSYIVYAILSFIIGRPWRFKWPKFSIMKEYMRYSYPLIGVAVALALSSNVAQILIQLYFHSYEVGGYAGDLRIISIITAFSGSLTILILPIMTSHSGSKEEYGVKVSQMVKYLAIFISPLTVFVAVFASPVLNLWSNQLIPFAFPLQLILVSTWFTTMATPFWTHFNAIGKTKVSGAINIITYLIIIALDIVLIPTYLFGIKFPGLGVTGAALAVVASGVTNFVLSVLIFNREVRVPDAFGSIKPTLISIIVGIPFYLLFGDELRIPALILIGFFLLYVLVYFGLLIASRTLSRQEVIEIVNVINLKKILKYAIDELRKPSQ
jgi:O-antigen/teichoic acid export membrane protein